MRMTRATVRSKLLLGQPSGTTPERCLLAGREGLRPSGNNGSKSHAKATSGVCAHGAGCLMNDRSRTRSIREAFH